MPFNETSMVRIIAAHSEAASLERAGEIAEGLTKFFDAVVPPQGTPAPELGTCDYGPAPHAKDSKLREFGTPCKNWRPLAVRKRKKAKR